MRVTLFPGNIHLEAVMNNPLLGASALLLLSGSVNGAPFSVNVVDAGGVPGGLGSPMTWTHPTNGAAYNNFAVAGNNPPSADLVQSLPAAEFDSYIALDSLGPTQPSSTTEPVVGYDCAGPGNYIGISSSDTNAFRATGGNGSLIGVWFNTFDVPSSPGWLGLDIDSIFIAQITLRSGSSFPSTAGVMVNIKDGLPGQDPNGVLGALRFGVENATNNAGRWSQAYHLAVRPRATLGVNAAFNGGTTYEIYIASIPAPGLTGIAAPAMVTAFRRRGPGLAASEKH